MLIPPMIQAALARSAALALATAVSDGSLLVQSGNATVIGFSSSSQKFGNTLVRATRDRRRAMERWIDSSFVASGGTNFVAAFEAVVDVLRATSTSSGCNRVVLFLSDGVPGTWTENDATRLTADLESLGNAHLITYALGSGADARILKDLACANGGILYEAADNANLGDIMAEYASLCRPSAHDETPLSSHPAPYDDTWQVLQDARPYDGAMPRAMDLLPGLVHAGGASWRLHGRL